MGAKTNFFQKIFLIGFGLIMLFVTAEVVLRTAGVFVSYSRSSAQNLGQASDGAYRILCLGESTTARGYPRHLQDILNSFSLPIQFQVINAGVPGTNTGNILMDLKENLERHRPHVVVTMMGINDGDDTVNYKGSVGQRITIFFRNLRIYKVIKIVRERIYLLFRKFSDIYLWDGTEFQGQRNFESAVVMFKWAIRLDSKNIWPYARMIRVYREANMLAEAEAVYQRVVDQFDIGDYHVHERLLRDAYGCIENLERNYPDINQYKQALVLNPENDVVQACVGKYYATIGEYDEAESHWLKALRLNPKNDYAHGEIMAMFRQLGWYDRAEYMYQEMIVNYPKFDRGYSGVAFIASLQRDAAKAEKYYALAKERRQRYFNPATFSNYNRVAEEVLSQGLKFVAVQYPMRDVDSLKKMLGLNTRDAVFVDNEDTFKSTLKERSFEEIFTDSFAGDFGHMTPRGRDLLARQVAQGVLKVLDKDIKQAQ